MIRTQAVECSNVSGWHFESIINDKIDQLIYEGNRIIDVQLIHSLSRERTYSASGTYYQDYANCALIFYDDTLNDQQSYERVKQIYEMRKGESND